MTATRPCVALATCAVLPHLDPDGAPLVRVLASRDIDVDVTVWDDPEVDWDAYDAVVVRSTWDYAPRREEFLQWTANVPRMFNTQEVIGWNTDKRYLRELESEGIPVIPTLWLDPALNLSSQAIHTRLPAQGDFVIKPVVSAGAKDTGRYQSGEAHSRGLAIQHAKRLMTLGRHVMVQPYVKSVDTAGEISSVFIDGQYSHSVRTNAVLTRGHRPTQGLYPVDKMRAYEATGAEREVASAALAAAAKRIGLAGSEDFLYSRVDLVTGDDGSPEVIELELTEPRLFLAHGQNALDHFADAIVNRVRSV